MFQESAKMKGTVKIDKFDEDGSLLATHTCNLVVDTGRSLMAGRLAGNAMPVPSHIAIGTGGTEEVVGDTTLDTETGRIAVSSSIITTNVTDDSVQYIASFGPGVGTGALVEAGIFNAATDGSMLSRTTFPPVNKQAMDSIVITWVIVFL